MVCPEILSACIRKLQASTCACPPGHQPGKICNLPVLSLPFSSGTFFVLLKPEQFFAIGGGTFAGNPLEEFIEIGHTLKTGFIANLGNANILFL